MIGQTVGNYQITHQLGEGGMGTVYLAENPAIGKRVAIKVLHAEYSSNPVIVKRFFNEAKAVNAINHANIVDVMDHGMMQMGDAQLCYFIMEFITGTGLAQALKAQVDTGEPMAPERALAIAGQIADALAAAHRKGIVHRDLKPDNVMLTQRGREMEFVKLLDFGIAKLSGDMANHKTRTGVVMGTPAYMSPEQCQGRADVDHRTDVYALGCLMYEMLGGRTPFVGDQYGQLMVQQITAKPQKLTELRKNISPHVEAVVMKAIEKAPDMRFPTMADFAQAIHDPGAYVEGRGGVAAFMAAKLSPSPEAVALMRPSEVIQAVTPNDPNKPTTLGAAAGEAKSKSTSSEGPKKKGGKGVVIGVAGAIAVAAVVIAVVATRSTGTDETKSAKPGPSEKLPVDKPAPPSGDPTMAKVTIKSDPPGAEIYIDGEDQHVVTPTPVMVPREKKSVTVTLKLDGYRAIQRDLGVDVETREDTIVLDKK